jgi:parvulin-like peptidyl-prolyl isomerase
MTAEKKQSLTVKKLLILIIIGFVAVAFVGSFAYQYVSRTGPQTSLAVVNGEPISAGSDSLFANIYRQLYEEQRQKSEEGVSEDQNRQLMRRALDTVIQRTLILQYAEREGIRVSRDAVLSRIVEKGYYAGEGKKFSEAKYNQTPQYTRDNIFKSEKEQLVISMFIDDFISTPKVSGMEVELFFKLVDYGKKIEYVYLRYDDVDEATLRDFYAENPLLFERTHAAHILIKDDEAKAEEIYIRVSEDPDQFEEIARQESQDTTAEKGGDLGWFYRDDMVAEFSEAAFKLKKGEISPPVKTVFGYHIIKALANPEVQPFEEALNRVKQEYVSEFKEQVEKATSEKSRSFLEQAGQSPDRFDDTAREMGLRVRRTDYITVEGQYILNEEGNTPLFEIMNLPSLVELVFKTGTGEIGGPVNTANGEILFRVTGEKEFNAAEFERAHDYVERSYRTLKENYLFNDWYVSALRNAKIVDNFNTFFRKSG